MLPRSRDEDGYLEAGDLMSGGYGAMEGDLGERLRPLAGFGRDLSDSGEEELEEEIWPGVSFTPDSESGTQTSHGKLVYGTFLNEDGWNAG